MNLVNVLLQTNQCNILRKFSFLNIPNIKTLDNREFSIKNFDNNNNNYFDTYNSKSINDESIQIKDIIENDKILETAKAHNDYNSIEEDKYLYFIKSTNPTRDVSYINDNQSVKKEKETIFFTKKIKKKKRGPKQIYFDRGGKKHDKESKDNIVKKVIRNFLKNILKKLNNKIKHNEKLKKIESNLIHYTYKDKYYYIISTTIREMLSEEISKRYINIRKDNIYYNRNIIKNIYQNKKQNKDLINFFNLKIIDVYNIYIGKQKEEKYCDFYGIEEDIKLISKDNEANYQKKYRKIALELIEILKENGK